MKLNPEHKKELPKSFAAIDWLIEKSKVFRDETEDTEWGKVRTVERSLDANLPHRMKTELEKLLEVGYRNPHATSIIGNLHWIEGLIEHRINWKFGSYLSTQNRIHFCYSTFEYQDGLPEGIDAA